MKSVVGKRLHQGVDDSRGPGGVGIGIGNGNETGARFRGNLSAVRKDLECNIAAVGGVGEGNGKRLQRFAPETERLHPREPAAMGAEVVRCGLEAGAADHIEGERIGFEDADFRLQREVVVERVADRGGLLVARGVLEAKAAMRLLLNFDDSGRAIARSGAQVIENCQAATDAEERENPGAAACEKREKVHQRPLNRRIAVRLQQRRAG